MTKHYSTVVEDIYDLFDKSKNIQFNQENVEAFGKRLAQHISNRVSEERGAPTLRFSNVGRSCNRQIWYSINQPEKAEPLSPQVQFKFLYGDIIEELVLFLAQEAGHTVVGQQDELDYKGIKGHRDGILDGLPIDVKSASSRTLLKFKEGLSEDPFGYKGQLSGYEKAAQGDPRVTQKGSAFLVVEKTTGELYLDYHDELKDYPLEEIIEEKKKVVQEKVPPPRYYMPEPEGKSGNLKLCTECSYCPFKNHCWPGLRTFLYSNKPIFLTKVVREPKVPEATN